MKYLPLLLLCICWSCSGSGDGSSSESSSETSPSMAEDTGNASTGGSSCLAEYNPSPCDLFTKDEMAALLEVTPDELEQEAIERIAYSPNKDLCNYRYNAGRKSVIKVAGREMEMTLPNTVIIGQFNVLEEDDMKYDDTYMAYFTKRYGKRTEEQKKAISESIDRAAETSNEVEKEQAETIKKMAEAQQFEMVEGIWDAASYDIIKVNNQLNFYVLHEDVVFRVEVNISNDTPENLAMAKKIATEIIEKCSN